MRRIELLLLVFVPIWAYINVFLLPYAVWSFALTQNYFRENNLILFRDIIFHHTELSLFLLFLSSKLFGNSAQMLQISSFILLLFLVLGIYITTKQISHSLAKIAIFLFLITFPPLFNNFQLEEMTAAVFALYGVYFFLKYQSTKRMLKIFLAGIFFALAIMGKQAAVGAVFAVIATLVWSAIGEKSFVKVKKSIFVCLLGLTVGILPFLLYYLSKNALDDFVYWNFIFNLTVYPKFDVPNALSEMLPMAAFLFLSLPASIWLVIKKQKMELKDGLIFFILLGIFLLPALLPSFWLYKLLLPYPALLILWVIILSSKKDRLVKFLIGAGLLLFIFPVKLFYIDYLPSNIFKKDYILEYGENDLRVVEWLKKNTSRDDKIMNLGNHYVTTLANRQPANKYVYIFPWLVYPYEQSTREILLHPPQVVIIDEQVLSDWPVLQKEWGFVQFVQNSYRKKASFGTYEIYTKD